MPFFMPNAYGWVVSTRRRLSVVAFPTRRAALGPATAEKKSSAKVGFVVPKYGLIAEEVAEVYPDLVARSADGQIETVKYQVLGPMLLNEVQRQERRIADQEEVIRRQQAAIDALLQRVSRLESAASPSQPLLN
jgi:hypothetical protein